MFLITFKAKKQKAFEKRKKIIIINFFFICEWILIPGIIRQNCQTLLKIFGSVTLLVSTWSSVVFWLFLRTKRLGSMQLRISTRKIRIFLKSTIYCKSGWYSSNGRHLSTRHCFTISTWVLKRGCNPFRQIRTGFWH